MNNNYVGKSCSHAVIVPSPKVGYYLRMTTYNGDELLMIPGDRITLEQAIDLAQQKADTYEVEQ